MTGHVFAAPRKLRTFVHLHPARRKMVLEAMVALARARCWLLVSPFRRVAARLGQSAAPSGDVGPALDERHRLAVQEIRWSIRLAARIVPFRAVCLQQAIAAKLMLQRRGVTAVLHYGIDPGGGTAIRAHAWLSVSDMEVTGYPLEPAFAEVLRIV